VFGVDEISRWRSSGDDGVDVRYEVEMMKSASVSRVGCGGDGDGFGEDRGGCEVVV